MTLKRSWQAIDATGGKRLSDIIIPIGKHEIERIPNPFGYKNAPWLVLKGTHIGAGEKSWRQWTKGNYHTSNHSKAHEPISDEWEIIFEE